jgi:GAF domain-containing protein
VKSIKEQRTGMAAKGSDLQLSEDDVMFLLTLLRNAASPLTTAQLVDALKLRTNRQDISSS